MLSFVLDSGARSPLVTGRLSIRDSVDDRHPRLAKLIFYPLYRPVDVDCLAGFANYHCGQVQSPRIESRPGDAEVISQAREKHPFQAAFSQIPAQPRRGRMIVLEERRVRVQVDSMSFAEDQLGLRQTQQGMKIGSAGSLNAVLRPEYLRSVRGFDTLECVTPRMTRRKRQVPLRMPVLRKHDMLEFPRGPVNRLDHPVGLRNSQRAARTEVILHVDNDQHILWSDFHLLHMMPNSSMGLG